MHGERFLTHTGGPFPSISLTALTLTALRHARPPHPAAKRFVQEAFLIGFAMRKALSVTAGPLLLERSPDSWPKEANHGSLVQEKWAARIDSRAETRKR